MREAGLTGDLQDAIDSVIADKALQDAIDSVIADKAKRLQSASNIDNLGMPLSCACSRFSQLKTVRKIGASFICGFKSTDPAVLLTHGTLSKDAHFVVQQLEKCEIALASSDSFKLDHKERLLPPPAAMSRSSICL